jgi:hypothetical protein
MWALAPEGGLHMDFEANHEVRMRKIAALLLENRTGTENWGEIINYPDKPCPKKVANKFFLCCLLDYQIKWQRAWENGERLIMNVLHDPDDIWAAITSFSEEFWRSKFAEYKLHRYPNAHYRLWRIGGDICKRYDGDASKIWQSQESTEVLCRLSELGAGEQISRMIVGALRDCRQIKGSGDVKADVHICRVIGRMFSGKETNKDAAVERARQLNPIDPWQLDSPLWAVGNLYCHANQPDCLKCNLAPVCVYALEHS